MPAGRPTKSDPIKIPMSVSIEYDLKEKLASICKRERISVSQVLVPFIRQWVQTHADGNATYVLDHFTTPGMVAVPALMRSEAAWMRWMQDNKGKNVCKQVLKQISTIQRQYDAIKDVM